MKSGKNELTKEAVLKLLKNIKDDAYFIIYRYNENGTFRSEKVVKNVIQEYMGTVETIRYRETSYGTDDTMINISDSIGLWIESLYNNQYYETNDTQGYMKYVDKHNKYNHIFIKIDKESTPKTISFKLGDKEKTLELIEEGFDGYVSKPYRQKYMKCVSAESLEKHCLDELFNPRMITVGKKVLRIR